MPQTVLEVCIAESAGVLFPGRCAGALLSLRLLSKLTHNLAVQDTQFTKEHTQLWEKGLAWTRRMYGLEATDLALQAVEIEHKMNMN